MSNIETEVMFKLFNYQAEANESLFSKTVAALADSYENGTLEEPVPTKELLLVSPTGSGKTVISLEHFRRLGVGNFTTKRGNDSPANDLVFVLLAPNRLHLQALARARAAGFEAAGFSLLLAKDLTSSEPLEANSVLFLNYGGVNKESNLAIKENEQGLNLPTIFDKTRAAGLEVVLLIDEAHLAAATDKSQHLIQNILCPTVIVNVTATPMLAKGKRVPGDEVRVNRQDVVDEGVIRKSIYFNADFDEYAVADREVGVNEQYIVAGLKKLKELRALHAESNTGVKPMMMVQIPSRSKEGLFTSTEQVKDDKLDDEHLINTLAVLKEQGYTVANGTVATYMSEPRHRSVEDLSELAPNNSPVDVFVFKAAAAVGVDLPRAQVQVMLRDPKSAAFAIQTVGRILRQPSQRHYEDDRLNHGYVYTAHDSAIDMLTLNAAEIHYPPHTVPLRPKYARLSAGWSLPNHKRVRTGQLSVSREEFSELWDAMVDKHLQEAGTTFKELAEKPVSLRKLFTELGLQWAIEDKHAKYLKGEDEDIDGGGIPNMTLHDRKLTGEEKERNWRLMLRQAEAGTQAPHLAGVIEAVLIVWAERVNWFKLDNHFQLLRDRLIGSAHNREWFADRVAEIVLALKKRHNITDYPYTVEPSPTAWSVPSSLNLPVDKDNQPLYSRDTHYMYGSDSIGWAPKELDSKAENWFADDVVSKISSRLEPHGYSLIGYYKQPEDNSSWALPYEDANGVDARLRLHFPDWALLFEREEAGVKNQHLLFVETKNEEGHVPNVIAKAKALVQRIGEVSKDLSSNQHIAGLTLNFPVRWDSKGKELHTIEVLEDVEKRSFNQWLEDTYLENND